jgi:hypothetical protein
MVLHISLVQLACWHWLPGNGQFAVVTHWTHIPFASQTVPPPWLHALPMGRDVVPHAPALQVAGWHWLPLGGQLPAVTHWTQVPLPSQMVPPLWLHGVP